jgi:hypothetical protein
LGCWDFPGSPIFFVVGFTPPQKNLAQSFANYCRSFFDVIEQNAIAALLEEESARE